MKAALLKKLDSSPVFEEVQTPEIENEEQELIEMIASPVKNLDKLLTSSSFYAAHKELPVIIGSDGIGMTQEGKRVYAQGITGMYAEKALVKKGDYVILPEKLSAQVGAALPNAVQGAVAPLVLIGKIKKGDTVLINGATGFTGQLAVQMAKHYGAEKVIATGRNEERLKELTALGADEYVLTSKEEVFLEELNKIVEDSFVDIVIDYLWGKSAEIVLKALSEGKIHPTRFVNVGNMAGMKIDLNAGIIRNSAIEISGAGLGSYTTAEFAQLKEKFIPETFNLAATGKLKIKTETAALSDIENAWDKEVPAGKRLVLDCRA